MGSIREYRETEAAYTHILDIKGPDNTSGETLHKRIRRKLVWILHGLLRYIRALHGHLLHRFRFTHACILGCCILFGGILWARAGDYTNEKLLLKNIDNSEKHMDNLRSQYLARGRTIIGLLKTINKRSEYDSGQADYLPHHRQTPGFQRTKQEPNLERLRMPMAYELMPHLMSDPDSSLTPAFQMGGGRSAVDYVIGIPTVKRDKESYLHITLTHLVKGMTEEQASSVLIAVLVGETDLKYVLKVAKNIETMFPSEVGNGLIEVFSPSPTYYPDFSTLRPTLRDSLYRTKWRTKENLDAIYLMAYAHPRGGYYLMLQDDVVAKKNYIEIMKNFIKETSATNPDWVFIEFCRLGGIGKLFKKSTILHFVIYVQLFYTNMPIDWLLESWLVDKACSVDKNLTKCGSRRLQIRPRYNKPLFQHIGLYSSLKGKIQKLKDTKFGTMELFFPHENPPLRAARTDIEVYGNHDLKKAYEGLTFFWGINPKAGATMEFVFMKPPRLQSFLFRSSNAEHASDILLDCVVEILPLGNNGTYLTVGAFDEFGLAEGIIVPTVGPLQTLRLRMTKDSNRWVILSEIHLKPLEQE